MRLELGKVCFRRSKIVAEALSRLCNALRSYRLREIHDVRLELLEARQRLSCCYSTTKSTMDTLLDDVHRELKEKLKLLTVLFAYEAMVTIVEAPIAKVRFVVFGESLRG